jgi:HNH endonuclease
VNPLHPFVAERALHRCEYCRAPELASNLEWEVEHIDPQSQGGTSEQENIALSCRACNLHKSNRKMCLDPDTQETVRLFHPRLDTWADHFGFDSDSFELIGQTAIGRATIACLRMNSQKQKNVRRLWVQMQLFP